eukprot:gene16694-18388_t
MAASSTFVTGTTVDKHGHPRVSYSKAVDYMLKKHSCLFEVVSEKEVRLSPRYIGRINDGIRETLDMDVLNYSDELNGVIFAYNQVKCLEMSACIYDETPFMYFKVTVKYIVFKPKIGKKIKGVVNKIGHGHIGCLVHDCFNAWIQKPNISSKNYDIGSECIFIVTGFDVHNDILSIKGDFPEDNLATPKKSKIKIEMTEDAAEDVEIKDSKKKEKQGYIGQRKMNGISSETEGEGNEVIKKHAKKNKRKNTDLTFSDDNKESVFVNDSITNYDSKKKKKKKSN